MNSQTKKYFNLDFAYLVELSKLDMYIRKIILEIIFLETNKSKKLILQGLHRGQKVVGCVGFQIVCNMNINDVYRTFSEKSGNVLFVRQSLKNHLLCRWTTIALAYSKKPPMI